ncbi:CACTA en-spm transposon protein [Cucumis melo var. makuwa]|uniref:CACTA en-spm transposon protein n=1 Tax=Cucumis melo var. makuwa TaxID=1194695 RepID=A0A5A7UAS8_CUCMM|nr:CACTA en-spm transposon protein [Cucumis melo var. makuwa]
MHTASGKASGKHSFPTHQEGNRNQEGKREEKPRGEKRESSSLFCVPPPSLAAVPCCHPCRRSADVCHFSYGSFFVLNLFMFEMTILQLWLCWLSCGSKSFLQLQYELAERKGESVDRVELFQETHVRAGTFVSQATEDAHNQMLELQSQPTPKGSQPLSEDEICDQVLGRRPGYSKGLGWGPKPKARRTASESCSSTSCSQSTEKKIELQAKLHEALEQIKVQDRNHQALVSQVESMKKMIEELTRAQQGPPHDP